MDFLDTAFYLVSTALALYFAYVRFRARMPLFGHAMMGTACRGPVLSQSRRKSCCKKPIAWKRH